MVQALERRFRNEYTLRIIFYNREAFGLPTLNFEKMRQLLIFTLVALIGFTSCSKDEVIKPRIGDAIFYQQDQPDSTQTEAPTVEEEVYETVAYSIKNTSAVFGVNVRYMAATGIIKTYPLHAGEFAIIKAVPGSIEAPIDIIIHKLSN